MLRGIYTARPITYRPPSDTQEALETFQRGVKTWEQLTRENPSTQGLKNDLALLYNVLALAQRDSGNSIGAFQSYLKSGKLWNGLAQDHPEVPNYRAAVGLYYHNLGQIQMEIGQSSNAEKSYAQSLTSFEEARSLEPNEPSYRAGMAMTRASFAQLLVSTGRISEAETELRKSIATLRELLAETPGVVRYREEIASASVQLGSVLAAKTETQAAQEAYRTAIEICTPIIEEDGRNTRTLSYLVIALRELAGLLSHEESESRQEASNLLDDAVRNLRTLVAEAPMATLYEPMLSHTLYLRALTQLANDDTEGFHVSCAESLQLLGSSAGESLRVWVLWTCLLSPDGVEDRSRLMELAVSLVDDNPRNVNHVERLGIALYRAGAHDEAAKKLQQVADARHRENSIRRSPPYDWLFLAMARHQLGQLGEAQEWLERAVNWTESSFDPESPNGATLTWSQRQTLLLFLREASALVKSPENEVGQSEHESANGAGEYDVPNVAEGGTG